MLVKSQGKPFLSISTIAAAGFSRFFSYSVLAELAQKGHSTIGGRIASQYGLFDSFNPSATVAEFYDALFESLVKQYRHEYIYKNAIAQKVLLGKHSLKTAAMLTELGVENCKADVVVLNGTSHVYEIKSEMDNFDRLERQLSAYKRTFDLITVITTECLFKAVEKRVGKDIGIMVMANDGYKFKKAPYREPASNLENVLPSVIFDVLQKKEYTQIIKDQFNVSLTGIPNTEIYKTAKSYFEKLTPQIAHNEMVRVLKKRNQAYFVSEYIQNVPNSLKAAYLSLRLSKSANFTFLSTLKEKVSIAFA